MMFDLSVPVEVMHVLATLDDHGQRVMRCYIEQLCGYCHLSASREIEVQERASQLREAVQHVVQNTRGLPPDCRVHLLNSLGELTRQ